MATTDTNLDALTAYVEANITATAANLAGEDLLTTTNATRYVANVAKRQVLEMVRAFLSEGRSFEDIHAYLRGRLISEAGAMAGRTPDPLAVQRVAALGEMVDRMDLPGLRLFVFTRKEK